ncbi:NmrA/HSCARG family protein [Natrinema soli]|uniref:NmrA/HSCARG family protein n=1 Tax=Natrinema soli TaxID=1930624 RepID=A0ABD5SJV4_9EURY|nr:NmrA/HSCARG family protein [Natrinema soli]
MSTRVLVVGATGNQGGAVVDGLLAADDDFSVYGLTRDATSEKARALADRGVTVVEGDLNDTESLRNAVADVDAVFAVTNYFIAGFEGEIEQGTNLAEVAAESDVDHFVYSSVGGADRTDEIEHFISKYRVEQRIADMELPTTVLRPVYFTYNFEGMRDDIRSGTLAMPLNEGVSLQLLDVADYGDVVARVFASPDEYVGETIEVGGDEQTLEEMAGTFTDVLGSDVEPVHVPLEDARERQPEDLVKMYEWFNSGGYTADIDGLESKFEIQFNSLATYLRNHGWGS